MVDRRLDPTTAQGEVEIDALSELFALDPQEGEAGGMNIELLLLHATEVGFANAIGFLGQLQGALVVSEILLEDGLTLGKCLAGRESVLDIPERAQGRAAVLGDGLFLFAGADEHLSFQCTALVDGSDETAAGAEGGIFEIRFQFEHLAADGAGADIKNQTRKPRRFGLADPVEGGGDTAFGGDEIGATLEHFKRHAIGHGTGQLREIGTRTEFSGGITA